MDILGMLCEELDEAILMLKMEVAKRYQTQGHKLDTDPMDLIREEVRKDPTVIEAILYLRDYHLYLDRGVSPNRIPFNEGSGKKQSDYIDGLADYGKRRLNLNDDDAKSFAFAVAKKHKKEGMPTQGSKVFSGNNKRTGFFSDPVDELKDEIVNRITASASNIYRTILTNMFNGTQKEITTVKIAV